MKYRLKIIKNKELKFSEKIRFLLNNLNVGFQDIMLVAR